MTSTGLSSEPVTFHRVWPRLEELCCNTSLMARLPASMMLAGQCSVICFRRRQCVFIAFDLLYLNGKDLRTLPLIERKAALKKLLRRKRSRILYLDHVEGDGQLLFEQIVAMDGIVVDRVDRTRRAAARAGAGVAFGLRVRSLFP